MAKTLNEVIQGRLAEKPDQAALGAGMQDQGAQIQKLLQAKSGKQVAGTGPAASSLAEGAAVGQTEQALGQVQRRGQLVGMQQQQTGEAQEQAADIQAQNLNQQVDAFKTQAARQTKELKADRSRAIEELDYKKSAAATEQMGILNRLGAEQYVSQLEMAGAKNRLQDEVSFKEGLQKDFYSDMTDLIETNLEFKSLINANDRDFSIELQQMDINTAMAVMRSQARGAENKMIWDAISGLAGAGTELVSKQLSKTSTPSTTTSSKPKTTSSSSLDWEWETDYPPEMPQQGVGSH